MNPEPMRALVVDDEPLARQAIQQLLTDVDWLQWAGEASDGLAAIDAIQSLQPELVFLDIQMPGANGIEVLERANVDVAVIFTTAYDEYAMTAFELGAIDYLRKPFGRERFMRALERARPFLEARRAARIQEQTVPLVERLVFVQQESRALTRIFVRDRANIIPVQTSDVLRFEADGDYVAVVTAERRHLIYINLADLSARLDAEQFVRIHRSHIVNLDRVAAMVAHDANRLEVRMVDGTRIVASRNGTQLLRARFM
jgi:two-component system LytT family response regulator